MNTIYTVRWTFRNDHTWHKEFESRQEAEHFIHTTGLESHPDITRVELAAREDRQLPGKEIK